MINKESPIVSTVDTKIQRVQRPVIVSKVEKNGVVIRLISAEHERSKMPDDPEKSVWPIIEREIDRSSLVWVEYLPAELKRGVLSEASESPISDYAKLDAKKGLLEFFERIETRAREKQLPVAVADIANGVTFGVYDRVAGRMLPILAPVVTAIGGVLTGSPEVGLAFAAMAPAGVYAYFQLGREGSEEGLWAQNRQPNERFAVDLVDARRLFTARAIEAEAARWKPGSQITYIAPEAHTSRIQHHLENPHDPVQTTKAALYSMAIGLPFSSRMFRHSDRHNSWMLVSDISTRPSI